MVLYLSLPVLAIDEVLKLVTVSYYQLSCSLHFSCVHIHPQTLFVDPPTQVELK